MTTELTVSDLSTPAPSGISFVDGNAVVSANPPAGSFLQRMLSAATTVQLPTAGWQTTGPEFLVFATNAITMAQTDVNISTIAQSGFLQTAAFGTVTYTDDTGTLVTEFVTPDPSNLAQNPTGQLGWLDLLAQQVYGVRRLAATFAGGPLAIANLKSQSIQYAAGAYHVTDGSTGATYSNPAGFVVPPSAIPNSGGTITGLTTGSTTTIATQAPHGLTTGDVVYVVLLAPNGITFAGGALSAFALVSATPTPTSLQLGVPSSGTYFVSVAFIPGAPIAGAGGVITTATSGTTTTITTSAAHGLSPGAPVYVSLPPAAGVTFAGGGTTAGAFVSTVPSPTTLVIPVASSGTYSAGPIGSLSNASVVNGAQSSLYEATLVPMQADVAGAASSAVAGQVTTAITQTANAFVSNVLPWNGSNWESNAHLVDRCVDSLAYRSPNGPAAAYVFIAETASQFLAAENPPVSLTNGPVFAEAFSNPNTGIITTVVASASPASVVANANVTPGCAQNPVTGVSNANPCVISCAAPTGMTLGSPMTVTVSGVTGVTGPGVTVLGTWPATYVSANSFSIPIDTTTASAYSGGGTVEGGDLGQIDRLLQQLVVPDGQTAMAVSAEAFPIAVVATVVVPQAYVAKYQAAVGAQLQAQIATYPLGGSPETAPANSVPWDDFEGALAEAGVLQLGTASVVLAVQSLTLSSTGLMPVTASGGGLAFPSPYHQALLVTPLVTVVGV